MPEKYSERPPTIDAMQFEGTSDSAIQINNWLSSFSATVMHDTMRNRLIIQTTAGGFLTVENTDWVTMNSTLAIGTIKDADFQVKYELEPEDV